MSKNKNKKKKDEPVIPEKYVPENQLENLGAIIDHDKENEENLNKQIKEINSNIKKLNIEHIKNTEKLNNNLNEKQRENAYLNEEIREIKDEKESFEKNLKENFEKKYEEIQEEKKKAIENITEEMNILKEDLGFAISDRDELVEKVKKLETEIERLKHVNNLTINNYENKIKDLNNKHHNKIKNTTDKFENFLKNNQELLDNDLYTVYRNLKLKFEKKLKECVDCKKQNTKLEEINREYKLDMDNNEDIINECAKEQLETKKKTLKLQEELQNKNNIIQLMKNEYQKQVEMINNKYTQILQDNSLEIQKLKNEIEDKNKKILIAQQNSKEVINITDARRLGYVQDVCADLESGRITSIIVPGNRRMINMFAKDDDIVISWDRIKCIGDDIILVEL